MNRWALEKSLLEKSQGAVKPWEVGRWTLPEITMFLEDPEERSATGNAVITEAELQADLEAWHQLTPLEKLRNFER